MSATAAFGRVAGRWSERFFAIDLRSIAAFRVMLAVAILMRLAGVVGDIDAFYTDDGLMPRSVQLEYGAPTATSLYFVNGTRGFAVALFVLQAAAALFLLAGFRSRAAAFVSWLLFLSLVNRNPIIGTGGDSLLTLLLFWAMFLPIGGAFSLDALLGKPDAPVTHTSVASAGLLLQTVYVYVFGALQKTGAEWTSLHSAVYAAMHYESIATHLAHWFRQFPRVMELQTAFVWWIELLTPVLLFSPIRTALLRMLTLPLLIVMHICFRLFLDIGIFWVVSIASLTVFIPSEFWNALARVYWTDAQRRIKIYYDKDCAFCRKSSLLLRMLFLPPEIEVVPAQVHPEIGPLLEREQSWVVVDASGRR
ncbi:MAG: HTTM domain-containing protein, partial [Micropepsaceae bacterium]